MIAAPGEGSGRYSVLLVDDDRALLETTQAALERHHDVVATGHPVRALRLVEDRPFHVVVADWMMPVMDGMELFRRIHRLDLGVACLLMTGRMEAFAGEVDREDRKLLGLIAKPFTAEQVLQRIAQLGRLSAMKSSVRRLRGEA